jgi:hypothetical protein
MIFQCSDLDRALEHPELMPDARAHAQTCPRCSEQLHVWEQISRVAPQLHEEWESPELWGRIRGGLIPTVPRRAAPVWRWALAAAALVLLGTMLWRPWRAPSPDFLTEEALRQVQTAEAAYARSIEKLSKMARPGIEGSPSPLAAAYHEKLLVLDAEIADIKSAAETNRYNAYVQTQLSSLYREKQKTLQEWLEYAKRNQSPLN